MRLGYIIKCRSYRCELKNSGCRVFFEVLVMSLSKMSLLSARMKG